jgi:hypothetical protein
MLIGLSLLGKMYRLLPLILRPSFRFAFSSALVETPSGESATDNDNRKQLQNFSHRASSLLGCLGTIAQYPQTIMKTG